MNRPATWGGGPAATGRARCWTIRPDVLLTVLGVGALVAATWPLLAAPLASQSLLGLIAHFCGMLVGYGVLVLLLLVARAPAIERGVGADVLTRWHAACGRLVIVVTLVHAWAAVAAWAQARQQDWLSSAWNVLTLPALPAATLGTAIMVLAAVLSARAARRRLRHETWHAWHLAMYVAIALTFGHQLAGPDLTGHLALQIGWALAYAYVFAVLLWYRVITPVRQATHHRLRVADIRAEGPDVVSIVVEGRHLDQLRAAAGQFFRWRFLTPDHWMTAHPFSLSAPPAGDRLRLTVKSLGDGSRSLQHLPVGTWVVAEGPYGAITADRRRRRDVLLIAGGVGITPMRALFESIPLRSGEDLLLLYRARNLREVLFRDELDMLAAIRGAQVRYVLDADRGVLTSGGLLHLVPNLRDRDVYMCGSTRLTAAVRTELRRAGLPPSQLHEERFSF